MGEDAPLELREGHVHMAWDQAFTGLAHVWPSTTPGYWWVDTHHHAIEKLVPSAEVEAALALRDFHAQAWSVWRGDPKPEHPLLRLEREIPEALRIKGTRPPEARHGSEG